MHEWLLEMTRRHHGPDEHTGAALMTMAQVGLVEARSFRTVNPGLLCTGAALMIVARMGGSGPLGREMTSWVPLGLGAGVWRLPRFWCQLEAQGARGLRCLATAR